MLIRTNRWCQVMMLAVACAMPSMGACWGQEDDSQQLRVKLKVNQQKQDMVQQQLELLRRNMVEAELQIAEAMAQRKELERRMDEARGLSAEVLEEVEVSASTVPDLVHRLESEKFSLEVERIGLEVRVKAISEAIAEARDHDDSLSDLAKVELKLQEEQLAAMQKRYESMKERAAKAIDAGLQSETSLQDQLLTYEAQLQGARARREASVLRAKMALANPPQVKELDNELRRATIELRVVDAKLSYVSKKLDGLRGTASLAERILLLREEVRGSRGEMESAVSRGKAQLGELHRRMSDLESEREMLSRAAKDLKDALSAIKRGSDDDE